jgi:hypothetical protein
VAARVPEHHELHEVVRLLRGFDGKVTPPLPHWRAMQVRAQDEATKARLKAEAAAAG